MQIRVKHTWIGVAAILLWSASPVFGCALKEIPLFLGAGIAFSSAFVAVFLIELFQGTLTSYPTRSWIVTSFILLINHVGYLAAFRFAPPAQIEVLYYIWPLVAMWTMRRLAHGAVRKIDLIGGAISLLGIIVLFSGELLASTISPSHVTGYSLALIAAIAWAGFACLQTALPRLRVPFGLACGPAAICCLIVHLILGPAVSLTANELALPLGLGVMSLGIGCTLWEQALHHGNVRLLSRLAYLVPILSVAWLVLLEITQPSSSLFLASTLVTLGSVVRPVGETKLALES